MSFLLVDGSHEHRRSTVRRRVRLGVKVVVSTVLLGWVLSRSNLGEVFTAAARAHVPLLLAAYVLNFVGILISAQRWRGLLHAHGVGASTADVVRSVMVGVFLNNVLPSTVGGDAMRAYDSYRMAGSGGAMSSVVVDRLLGVLVLTMFALLTIPFSPQLTSRVPLLPLWVGVGTLLLLGLSWLIFLAPPSTSLEAGVLSRLPAVAALPIRMVLGAFDRYRGRRAVLARALGWSVLLQANVIGYYIIIASALGFAVPIHHFFVIVPLALFVMMVPITVNGIGLRENVLALFLATYGIAHADAVAYAWLVYLGGLIAGLAGGLIYAVRRVEPVPSTVTDRVERPGAGG